jgi:hypothetical protein
LSRATIARRTIAARQFFKVALDKELIAKNPFVGVRGGNQRNKHRLKFVDREWVDQMVAIADRDWRILLTLARYGGIRLPSEVVRLRWRDVDFKEGEGSILIHSVKTEHHEGKQTRRVPLYDEIREVLEAAHRQGVDEDDFVIANPIYRHPKANLRTQFERIALRAGVTPWAKAFQNMRATRETELGIQMPMREACDIIGNSEVVAFHHYQMPRPDFLRIAIERDRAAKKEAQNVAHTPTDESGNERTLPESVPAKSAVSSGGVGGLPLESPGVLRTPGAGLGDTGLEPVTSGV